MFIEILLAGLIGVAVGIITGLAPGIHINLVAALIIALMPFVNITPLHASILIISIAITHIFLDFIPTTFLGIPESDNVISLLPSQELLLAGHGHKAIFLSIFGCLSGCIIISAFSPILLQVAQNIYGAIQSAIPYILLFAMLILLLKENNKLWAAITIIIASIFGVLSFRLNSNDILFPMFSGMFGISSLLISISQNTKIPKQEVNESIELEKKATLLTLTKGFFASLLVGFLPGLGSAQASVLALSVKNSKNRKDYILMNGAINSIVMVIAVIALFTIHKARNGAIAVISEIFNVLTIDYFILFIGIILFVAGISAVISMFVSKIFIRIIQRINYKALSYSIIMIIFILVLILCNIQGILILVLATAIGLMPILKRVSRNHLMACLITPVIIYYLF